MSDEPKNMGREISPLAGAATGMGTAATVAAVSVCCAGPALGPVLIGILGVGPIVALEGLRPYALPLLGISAGLIGFSFWSSYRTVACSTNRRAVLLHKTSKVISWIAALVWLGAVLATYAR